MGNIIFGWKNRCLDSGVTFTPSNEATDHDADNLGRVHPSDFWRIDDVTAAQNVAIAFQKTVGWDIVAPLYCVTAPHQNILEQGFDIGASPWTLTSAIVANDGSLADSGGIQAIVLTVSGAGSVQHRVRQTYTKVTPASSLDGSITASLYFESGQSNFELELGEDNTNRIFVQINGTTGAVNSSGAGGTWTLTSATSTLVAGSLYRIVLVGVSPGTTTTDFRTSYFVLDSGFNKTFVAGSESCRIGGGVVEIGAVAGAAIESMTGAAGYWTVGGSDTASVVPFSPGRSLEDWYSGQGWVHSYKYYSTRQWADSETVVVYDPGNADSQLDISNIYIGETWSPFRNVSFERQDSVDSQTGARMWSLTIAYASEAEYKADALPMALVSGVGTKSSGIADGGQEYRRDRQPILVIIDPEATTYVQEDMMYGFLDDFQVRGVTYMKDADGAGNAGPVFAINFKFKEVLA